MATLSPRERSAPDRCDPIKPAPPVRRIFILKKLTYNPLEGQGNSFGYLRGEFLKNSAIYGGDSSHEIKKCASGCVTFAQILMTRTSSIFYKIGRASCRERV